MKENNADITVPLSIDSAIETFGDLEGAKFMISNFEKTTFETDVLTNLENCIADKNYPEIRRLAHSLKGSGWYIGVKKFSDIAENIQFSAEKSLGEKIDQLFKELIEEGKILRKYIQEYVMDYNGETQNNNDNDTDNIQKESDLQLVNNNINNTDRTEFSENSGFDIHTQNKNFQRDNLNTIPEENTQDYDRKNNSNSVNVPPLKRSLSKGYPIDNQNTSPLSGDADKKISPTEYSEASTRRNSNSEVNSDESCATPFGYKNTPSSIDSSLKQASPLVKSRFSTTNKSIFSRGVDPIEEEKITPYSTQTSGVLETKKKSPEITADESILNEPETKKIQFSDSLKSQCSILGLNKSISVGSIYESKSKEAKDSIKYPYLSSYDLRHIQLKSPLPPDYKIPKIENKPIYSAKTMTTRFSKNNQTKNDEYPFDEGLKCNIF